MQSVDVGVGVGGVGEEGGVAVAMAVGVGDGVGVGVSVGEEGRAGGGSECKLIPEKILGREGRGGEGGEGGRRIVYLGLFIGHVTFRVVTFASQNKLC